MPKTSRPRRKFLKLAAGAALGAGAPNLAIERALALPANRVTGTIKDVEHVVILMQENRAFDHYYGTLRGVRGYGDPRAITLPNGQPVWFQPKKPKANEDAGAVGPFHFDTSATRAETLFSLDHSWKGSHAQWKNHDAWIRTKGPLTMGYFTRADIPFYYALADAFTICDGYHASIFGPTNPNRLFLFSGTSGLTVGDDSKIVVDNPPNEPNETADPANDSKTFAGLGWTTYAERLERAGVSWRLYQEFDNYGDNGLAYFAKFRGLPPSDPLYQKGRAWVEGATPANAKTSEGEHLVAAFAADVATDRLPQVSWIVAPYKLCEHPEASPGKGEFFTARLIEALAANPAVWAKTAFILNYDENDGFFDHMPPIVPAAGPALGKSTVDVAGEVYHGEPVGLGPRVPMMVISPWTKGGFVNSQVFDHTSVIRFLEARFGVAEPNISPWRRAVSGDLTSVFDFDTPNKAIEKGLPDASSLPARAEKARALPWPKPGTDLAVPRQEAGVRPARALPYAFEVTSAVAGQGLSLSIANVGAAGAGFRLYAPGGRGPWFYTVQAGKAVGDSLEAVDGAYDLALHGPNGFLRVFQGKTSGAGLEAAARFEAASGRLLITLTNTGTTERVVAVAPNAYLKAGARRHRLAPGAKVVDAWAVAGAGHWYDFSVTSKEDAAFLRRFAGHGETGRPSISDPLLGRQA
ncbi:MAG: phospholipase C, phosphocholine-specific [Caulobacteraceae bacterium]|nr:phospholipase C, phosphocholine-specific [Caulobacteraceae bacterium]